jgi:hypothetical protein
VLSTRTLCDPPNVEAEELVGEAEDAGGERVVLPARVWNAKLLRDHPELEGHHADVLRAVSEPDHVAADPAFENRRRHYLKGAGPSRWLLVVVSYEQEPARIISAFGYRKDPPSWSK